MRGGRQGGHKVERNVSQVEEAEIQRRSGSADYPSPLLLCSSLHPLWGPGVLLLRGHDWKEKNPALMFHLASLHLHLGGGWVWARGTETRHQIRPVSGGCRLCCYTTQQQPSVAPPILPLHLPFPQNGRQTLSQQLNETDWSFRLHL